MSQLTNTTLNQKELVIDEEFRKLIPKLTNEENEQLETSIKEDKCRDSIITWNGTILDGHNRYDICKRNNIDFHTVSKNFKNRNEVKLWIIDNQFGRRNLTKYDRSVLALKKKEIIAANAKKNQGARTDILHKSVKSINTQKQLAKDAGVSHDTIYKVEVIERSATEDQKDKIRNQTSTINKIFKDIARQEKREKFGRENAKLAEQYVEDDSIRIIHGDFYEVCKDLEENSVDFVLTDLPYPKEYIHLWEQLGETAGRLLKPSGFLVSYSGHMHLDRVMHDLGQHLNFYWILSLLHSGPTQLVNPRNVVAGFKPILVYQKPPFKKLEGSPLRDVITKDNRDKDFHEWGQGELGVEILMKHFSKPNDLILDPCMGGGTTLLVAKKLKRRAIGIDIDHECIKTTQSRLVKNHYENKTEFKPVIMEKLGLTEEDLKKPEVDKDRGTHGDGLFCINQFEGVITDILTENNKTTKDIVSVRVPFNSSLAKDKIEIDWVKDDEEPDPSGPTASPQLLKADDYEDSGKNHSDNHLFLPDRFSRISPHLNKIILGDCLEKLKDIPDNSVHLLASDPPYGINLMGKNWDKAVPTVEVWRECHRVLKDGSFGFIMCLPRQDILSRMIINLQDAGFKTDFTSLYWTHAGGPPKGKRLGDNLYRNYQPKPAVEVIIVVMKGNKGVTYLDDCRIPYTDEREKWKHDGGIVWSPERKWNQNCKRSSHPAGRFPANLLVSDQILGRHHSRFFSLDTWAEKNLPFLIVPKASPKEKGEGNNHPTVKPIKLMSYLITMGSRERDVVLDPFCGSGTTCVAAKMLNRKYIGIEMDEEYHKIATQNVETIDVTRNKGTSKVVEPEISGHGDNSHVEENATLLKRGDRSSVEFSERSPSNSRYLNSIVLGDCFDFIKQIEKNSIDLGLTSPPYADTKSYGKGVKIFHPDDYVDWILPLFNEIARILKPTGSFILNINDRIVNKQRHIYVYELIVRAVKETPLKLYDVYFWKKPTALPNGNSHRLNNVTEYLIHFCKDQNQVKWNMDAIREPYDENTIKRCQYPVRGFHLEVDKEGKPMRRTQKMIQLNGKGKIPSNVFHFPTASAVRGKKHPAAFHIDLPSWFIKALTNEGDVVTDVFSGSGSTCLAAKKLNRKYIGIEMNEKYHEIAEERVENAALAKAA